MKSREITSKQLQSVLMDWATEKRMLGEMRKHACLNSAYLTFMSCLSKEMSYEQGYDRQYAIEQQAEEFWNEAAATYA